MYSDSTLPFDLSKHIISTEKCIAHGGGGTPFDTPALSDIICHLIHHCITAVKGAPNIITLDHTDKNCKLSSKKHLDPVLPNSEPEAL